MAPSFRLMVNIENSFVVFHKGLRPLCDPGLAAAQGLGKALPPLLGLGLAGAAQARWGTNDSSATIPHCTPKSSTDCVNEPTFLPIDVFPTPC